MNIVVIGLGSMGKRRVRLLGEVCPGAKVCGVDAKEERRAECAERFGIDVYQSLGECLENSSPEAAFICTPPLSHAAITRDCLLQGLHVFSEINLVAAGYDENIRLAKEKGLTLFLSSTPMYREEIRYITGKANSAKLPVNYSFHVGQYLPDWHPWDVLSEFFISKKETNGCREIFAIELPWLLRAFGPVRNISVMKHKASSLPIDYDDSYFVSIEHENGNRGVLTVDVVSREAVKHLEVFGEELFITWDGTPDTLIKKNLKENHIERVNLYSDGAVSREEGYSRKIIENAYAAEIKNFLAATEGRERPLYSFEADMEILRIIDEIEGR